MLLTRVNCSKNILFIQLNVFGVICACISLSVMSKQRPTLMQKKPKQHSFYKSFFIPA
jgi:hypothetical protein